jgi:hypothetical protein
MKVHEEEKRKLTKKPRRFDLRFFKKIKASKNLPGLMTREEIFLLAQKVFFCHQGAKGTKVHEEEIATAQGTFR